MINNIKNIIIVYFTNFPYTLYNKANETGNFAQTGIALGLFYSQQIFWIANLFMIINYYVISNKIFFYLNLFFCFNLYILALSKTIHLLKYLPYL